MDKDTQRDSVPRIGIGLTTTPNREYLYKQWMEQFHKHTKEPYHLHIHCDEQYRGVAHSKNQNLRALKDCDYVFLFDDDCWPIADGWIDFFITSDKDHLLFLNPFIHGSPNGIVYKNCGGVFMFMTKKTIERVGAFNEKFNPYGFEHAEYSNRCYGLTNFYLSLNNTDKYLRALDYEGYNRSSLTDAEKQTFVKKNWDKYFKENPKIYIPL